MSGRLPRWPGAAPVHRSDHWRPHLLHPPVRPRHPPWAWLRALRAGRSRAPQSSQLSDTTCATACVRLRGPPASWADLRRAHHYTLRPPSDTAKWGRGRMQALAGASAQGAGFSSRVSSVRRWVLSLPGPFPLCSEELGWTRFPFLVFPCLFFTASFTCPSPHRQQNHTWDPGVRTRLLWWRCGGQNPPDTCPLLT